MDSGLVFFRKKVQIEVINVLITEIILTNMQLLFLLDKMLTDGLESCGLLVDYCHGFHKLFELSFLVSKWWNMKFLQIYSG